MTVAILLAAGAGSRFTGGGHKLDATIRGRSVAERAIAAALDSGIGPVLVVTGSHPISLPPEVTEVANPDWADGQITSRAARTRGRARARRDGGRGRARRPAVRHRRRVARGRGVDRRRSRSPRTTVGAATRCASSESVWPLLPETGDEGARALIRFRPDLVEQVPCAGRPPTSTPWRICADGRANRQRIHRESTRSTRRGRSSAMSSASRPACPARSSRRSRATSIAAT